MIELTRVQARFPEVGSIVARAPALRLNEIVLLEMKGRGRDLMTVDDGGLRWVKPEELATYVAACRDALERSEAILNGLRRPVAEAGPSDAAG